MRPASCRICSCFTTEMGRRLCGCEFAPVVFDKVNFNGEEKDPTEEGNDIYLEYRRSHRNSRPQTLNSRQRSFGRINWQHLCHSRWRTMRSRTINSGASLPSRKTSTYLPELTTNCSKPVLMMAGNETTLFSTSLSRSKM
uniref:(northern house mosquito) hypothetical protein n=1 Tax=Culex pipiens TaxID=7175 RepID=A0A8D8HJJ6_CULPI